MLPLVLASGSPVRRTLLTQTGLNFDVQVPRIDEAAAQQALIADGTSPRNMADALAELKAARISAKTPDGLVIGSDQTLDFQSQTLFKSKDKEEASELLSQLCGNAFKLHAAAVIYESGRPVWRHVSTVNLQMRPLTTNAIARYLDENWDSVKGCVGAFKIEEEGVRLFSRITGDYFAILGLPLIELLNYLTLRGYLKT